MIVSVPSKCGWQRFYGTLVKKAGIARNILPNHGDDQHADEFKRRVLIVRDPLDRTVSQYYYVKYANRKWVRLNEHFKTFYRFTKFLTTEERNRSFMFQPLHEFVENFDPHLIIEQERIEERWEEAFPKDILPIYQKTSKHGTPTRRPIEETISKVHPDFIDYLKVEYGYLKDYYSIRKHKKVLGL